MALRLLSGSDLTFKRLLERAHLLLDIRKLLLARRICRRRQVQAIAFELRAIGTWRDLVAFELSVTTEGISQLKQPAAQRLRHAHLRRHSKHEVINLFRRRMRC